MCQGGSAFIITERAERVPTYSIEQFSCVFYVFVSSSAGTCVRRMLPEVVHFHGIIDDQNVESH